jgi:hypothetical protein
MAVGGVTAFYNPRQRESSAGVQFSVAPDRLSSVLYRINAIGIATIVVAAAVSIHLFVWIAQVSSVLYIPAELVVATFILVAISFHHNAEASSQRKRLCVTVGIGAANRSARYILIGRKATVVE